MKRKDALWVMQMCRDRDARSEAEREAFDTAIEALKSESIFSADRPRGEWIRTDFEDCVDGERIKWARWNCSECGVERKIGWVKDVNFCPNCGADMRGDDK